MPVKTSLDVGRSQALPTYLAARIPYAAELGMRYLAPSTQENNQHVFYLPFQAELVGNTALPALHGGAIAGFMESAALFHLLLEHSDAKRLPKTIDFNIDYLRSAGPRETFASCEVVKLGRRVALVHIRCWQRHYDRPVALVRAHYLWEALPSSSELAETISA